MRQAMLLVACLVLSACATNIGSKRVSSFDEGVVAYDAGDFATAYRIWDELAREDDPAAMRNVAQLLRQGRGVEKDSKRAFRLYTEAAEKGLVTAMANLGDMYLAGEGTERNPQAAAAWYARAASAGLFVAQWKLAEMYENGTGVPVDKDRAQALLEHAARNGYVPAQERLKARGTTLDADGLTCINLGFRAGTPEIADCRLRLMEFRQREADRSAAIAEQERQESLRRLQLGLCLISGTCDPTRRPTSRSDDDDLHPVFITLPSGRSVTCHRIGPSINCM
jgi:TPR repeat protein